MITAKLKHLRIAPRKVRLVANLIKGMSAEEAKAQLKFLRKKGAEPVLKLLNSAIANAEHNFNLSKENLCISQVKVDSGPTLKRWLPRAMGRATPLWKRTSHISISLSQKPGLGPKKEKTRPVKTALRQSKPVKSAAKKIKKIPQRKETPKRIIAKKRGWREMARKMFRRKSI